MLRSYVLFAIFVSATGLAGAPAARKPWVPPDGIKAAYEGGNTIGGTIRESRVRTDGYRHIDTPAIIRSLQKLHANTFFYLLWGSASDWDDLRKEFLPAAQSAKIDVWLYLVPPSECRENCSYPYKTDYKSWAREIAQLSRRYPKLKGWAIDDFFRQVTPEAVKEFTSLAKSINPDLAFYVCTYYSDALNDAYLDAYKSMVDGIVFPFADEPNHNTQVASSLNRQIEEVQAKLEPRHLGLIVLIYCGRNLNAEQAPKAAYVDETLRRALPYVASGRIDGVICYGAPIADPPNLPSEHLAGWGDGRLSFAVGHGIHIQKDTWAAAYQTVNVDPNSARYELSFWQYDPYTRHSQSGVHLKQVLIDNHVLWSEDVSEYIWNMWLQGGVLNHPVSIPKEWLQGKQKSELRFRLYEAGNAVDYPVDVGFDNLEAVGLTISNPGFETQSDWQFDSSSPAIVPSIDIYHSNEPHRILEAIAKHFR